MHYQAFEVSNGDFLDASLQSPHQEERRVQTLRLIETGGTGVFKDMLEVDIHNDQVGEASGSIMVKLLIESTGTKTYRINAGASAEAIATIHDDDAPVMTIKSPLTATTEVTGAKVRFPVTALVSPNRSISIYYTLTESTGGGDFIAPSEESATTPLSKSVDFSENSTTGDLLIPINVDNTPENDSMITVTLAAQPGILADANYNLDSPNTPATATIKDGSNLPLLTIGDRSSPIAEDATHVNLIVTSSGTSTHSLTVRYQASEVGLGDFLTPAQAEEKMQPLNFDQRQTSAYIDSLRVEIDDDGVGEATGAIKVTLLPETGSLRTYRVPTDGRQDTEVTIWDNDVPELTIIAAEAWQTEGSQAKADFKVKARFSPNKILNVRMTPTESGDFIGGTTFAHNILAPVPLDFRNDKTEVSLAVDIASDDDPELNGSITITLEDEATFGDSYTVGTPSDATVMIRDDDSLPLLTIADLAGPVLEDSGPVMFVVTSSKSGPLNVHYIASEEIGDFLDESVPTPHQAEERDANLNFNRTLSTDPYTAILEVDIHDDLVKESTGAIKVTLLLETSTTQTYIVPNDGRQEAIATIWDNEVPELTITTMEEVAETEAVSTTADFTITASFNPTSNPTVFFTPTETGNFIGGRFSANTKASQQLDFKGGNKAILPIDVATDTSTESDGSITVTLEADNPVANSYTVGTENDATITIIDDDSLPVLSIADLPGPVEEDSTIDFVINSSIMPAGGTLNVHYQATEMTGNFLDETTSPSQTAELDQNLTFSQSSPFEATLEVDIHDDQDGEITGVIKVTLLTEDTLSDQPTGAQTYLVNSNEKETEATIWDDDVPELTIVAKETAVTEAVSATADFTVTARFSPNSNLTVYFTPTVSGDFLGSGFTHNTKTDQSLDFRNGETTDTLEISVASDSNIESHGSITVTLNNENTVGSSYTVGTPNDATVRVVDDDSLPTLTISAPTKPALESVGTVDFMIMTTATTNPGSIMVRYDPSEVTPGEFLNESATPTSQEAVTRSEPITFSGSSGNFTATLPVPIHDDQVGERTGQIQVELLADDAAAQTYRIDSNNTNTVMATVLDDDAPELKISGGNLFKNTFTEGIDPKAFFTVTSVVPIPNVNNTLTVFYTPVSTNFIQAGSNEKTSKPLTFAGSASGPYTATLEIDIHNDEMEESEGTIEVTLNEESTPATTYTVIAPDPTTPENTASVTVSDDDSVTLLTITGPASPVLESANSVDFKITATDVLGNGFRVRYNTSEVSGADFLNETASQSQEGDMEKRINFMDSGDGMTSTATLPISIHNDQVGEPSGSIQVTLLADDATQKTYRLGIGPGRFARAMILDDEAPELKITAGAPVTEGIDAKASFTVTSAVPIPNSNNTLTVFYTPVSVNFIQSGSGDRTSTTLTFTGSAMGTYTAPLEIDIHNDDQPESNGSIKVTLNEESTSDITYSVVSTQGNFASVTVRDDDSLPLLTITAPSSPVNENTGLVSFDITATVPPTSTITPGPGFEVRYDPSEFSSGDFLKDDNPNQEAITADNIDFTGSGNTYTAKLLVPIDNDQVAEQTGQIQVTLLPIVATYRVSTDGTQTAMATIWDDDAPELLIKPGAKVQEGPNKIVNFTIEARISPREEFDVYYSAIETSSSDGNFIADNLEGSNEKRKINFNGNTEVPFTFTISTDDRAEGASILTVTLNDDSDANTDYTVAMSPLNMAEVTIEDDDSLPELTIADTTTGTAENVGSVDFTITTTTDPGPSLMVRYDPAEVSSGDFLDSASNNDQEAINTKLVNFSTNDSGQTYTGTLNIPIHDDAIGESTGQIMVTLLNEESDFKTYQIRSGNISALATIWDNDAPELTIMGTGFVREADGAKATFTVSAKASPNKEITVYYTVSEISTGNGDFLDNTAEAGNKEKMLDFSGGAKSVNFTIPLDDKDDIIEDSSTISVTLRADEVGTEDYKIPDSPTPGTVEVFDGSVPTILIAADNGFVAENVGTANFTLTAIGITADMILTIKATPAEDGSDFLTESVASAPAIYPIPFSDPDGDNIYTGEFPVLLDTDTVGEATGQIKLTLNPDEASPPTYIPGPVTEGVITIWDDDAPELVISAGSDVTEGPNVKATFKIISNVMPNTAIPVQYTAIGESYIANSGTKVTANPAITFESNPNTLKYEGTLEIDIDNDELNEPDGTLQVTLNSESTPTTYYLNESNASQHSSSIMISDDDPIPTISVINLTPIVEESGSSITIPVLLSNPTTDIVYIDWSTAVGSATAEDFTEHTNETLEISSGTTGDIEINIEDDDVPEGIEKFEVILSNARGATFANDSSTIKVEVFITEQTVPTLAFKESAYSITEDVNQLVVAVELTPQAITDVTFTYEIIDGTTTAGEDYTIPDDLTGEIITGSSEDSITIPIIDDMNVESIESFTVRLSKLSGAIFASGFSLDVVVTIVENDFPELSFKTTDFEPREDLAGGAFNVELQIDNPSSVTVTFDITLDGGTAIKGKDYTNPNLQGEIALDNNTTTISIPIINDDIIEENKTFNLTISNLVGANFANGG